MSLLLCTLNSKYIHSNLAIRLLYQLNKNAGNISWKEFTIKEDKDEIAEYCSNFEVVCFSVYIWNITPTLEVCRKIKSINPSIKIMLGGPEVSYEYEPVIALDEVDYIVVGEGEIPFRKFVENNFSVKNISGIVSKQDGHIIYLPNMEDFDLKELEDINPYIDDDTIEMYNKVLYVETSRGCPYKCEFCLASLDNRVRYLTMPRIKENLLFLMQHGRVVKFLDRTFNVKKDFTLEIFQFILDNHKEKNIFQFEITADILHKDIIAYINETVPAGIFRFEIGIQTVNQQANLEVSRKQNFYKTSDVINLVRDKIEMHLDLIVGLPLDYWDDVKLSIEEVFKLYPPELQLGFLKFLKGTPVRQKYEQHQYVFDPNPPYQIIESKYLSKKELYQITQLEFALEAYWNKKRLLHTLKYITNHYSIFDFLLGLGKLFQIKSNYHKHSLQDIYDVAYQYIQLHFAEDKIMKQMFAIDFCLQQKTKSKTLYVEEVEMENRNKLIQDMQLNLHKFRYSIFDIDFDYSHFNEKNEIKKALKPFVIKYNGVEYPTIISH